MFHPLALRLLAAAVTVLAMASAFAQSWQALDKDGLHDPEGPAVRMLQQPAEALSKLPPDTAGNMVRWVQALQEGHIQPRTNIYPGTKIQVLDKDILLNLKGGMPVVRFPHRRHTEWLDCSNCHDHLFKRQTGATKISMFNILQGQQCGLCHGAVAFPLTECSRCHSVSHKAAREELAAKQAAAQQPDAGQAAAGAAPAAHPAVRQAAAGLAAPEQK